MSYITGKELSKKRRTTKDSSKPLRRAKTRTSREPVGKGTSSQDIPDIADIYRDSLKTSKEYEACLTTTIYGGDYLDPDKCKARGFDPIKACEEEENRISLSVEWIERRTKEIGRKAQFEEYISKMSQVDDEFDKNPKVLSIKNIKEPKNKIREIRSLLVDASYLVGHKIKHVDGSYVKVIAVKMNEEEVLLEVEKKVGDNLDYYKIPYQKELIKLIE